MAIIYSKTCDICGKDAIRRDSVYIQPASSRKKYLVCNKCGKTLNTFLKKKGLLKTMHPKTIGSKKNRLVKTKVKK